MKDEFDDVSDTTLDIDPVIKLTNLINKKNVLF